MSLIKILEPRGIVVKALYLTWIVYTACMKTKPGQLSAVEWRASVATVQHLHSLDVQCKYHSGGMACVQFIHLRAEAAC